MVFNTPRLTVRIAQDTDGDIDALYNLWKTPEVMTKVGFPRGLPIERDGVRDSIRSRSDPSPFDKALIVESKESGKFVGECKLGAPDAEGLSTTDVKLIPEFWGKKYGIEIKRALLNYLFSKTDCTIVEATPNKTNAASIHMQEAVGAKRVGETVFPAPPGSEGYRTDVSSFVYQVTRETWADQPLGYIFDFDGVIADSMQVHVRAWSQAYSALYSQDLVDPERLIGMATVEIAKLLTRESGSSEEGWKALQDQKLAEVYKLADEVELMPEVEETLGHLLDRRVPFGICSNSRSDFVKRVLDRHGIPHPAVVGLGDTRERKPDPAPYLRAIGQLGLQELPHRVPVFEDSTHGAMAGIAAGMPVIGISSSVDAEDLHGVGCKEVYPSVAKAFAGRFIRTD